MQLYVRYRMKVVGSSGTQKSRVVLCRVLVVCGARKTGSSIFLPPRSRPNLIFCRKFQIIENAIFSFFIKI
jgi:hypothetical protein